jgi:hypothetical protein
MDPFGRRRTTTVGDVTGLLAVIADVIFHGARLGPETDWGYIQTPGSRQIHRHRRAASHVKNLQRQPNTSLSLERDKTYRIKSTPKQHS